MIRLSRLADYGIVIVTHLAREPARFQAAPEIAVATQIPQPVASKVLKMLARAELLAIAPGCAWRLWPRQGRQARSRWRS